MLETLRLDGFRRFESFQLTGLRPVNVLVGQNDCGKTSILEAVELLVSGGSTVALLASLTRRNEINEAAGSSYVNVCHLFYGHRCPPGTRFKLSGSGSHPELAAKILNLDECGEIAQRWEARASRLLARIIHERILTEFRVENLQPCSSSNWSVNAVFRAQAFPLPP